MMQSNVPYEYILYSPPILDSEMPRVYRPTVISGKWRTKDHKIIIEFRKDGTFKVLKSPMNFCTHTSNVPDKWKTFHCIEEHLTWSASEHLLTLSLNKEGSSRGYGIRKLDEKHLDIQSSNSPVVQLVRVDKTESNQQVDPIVKTPVDEVKAQGTQPHP